VTDPWAAAGSASVLTTLGTLPSQVSGRLPLWYQVSQSLRAFVAYQRGSELIRLPTEAMLARHYGVSVATVRQALATLEADGLIMRHRRRGTFIKPGSPGTRALRVLGSVDTVLAQQASDQVQLLGRGIEDIPAPLREHFPGEPKIAVVRRLRFDGAEATSYAENFIPLRYDALITDEDLTSMPVTMVLRDRLKIPLARIENSVEAQSATPHLAALLSVGPASPILLSANLSYDAEDRVVDAAYIHYRGDRFRFSITVDVG
jgi:GntR family transcriptional regulator